MEMYFNQVPSPTGKKKNIWLLNYNSHHAMHAYGKMVLNFELSQKEPHQVSFINQNETLKFKCQKGIG